jgi:hypothetical protein
MPNANSKPDVIFLDKIESGQCRLLVRWNIVESTKEDPMTGETRTSWDYSERVIWWYLDMPDIGTGTLDEIMEYLNLDATKTRILNLVMPTEINYTNP